MRILAWMVFQWIASSFMDAVGLQSATLLKIQLKSLQWLTFKFNFIQSHSFFAVWSVNFTIFNTLIQAWASVTCSYSFAFICIFSTSLIKWLSIPFVNIKNILFFYSAFSAQIDMTVSFLKGFQIHFVSHPRLSIFFNITHFTI